MFGDRLGREVSYEADAPDDYFGVIAPLIGNGTAVGLAANYRAMAKPPGRMIIPDSSAQKPLGVTPQTASNSWPASACGEVNPVTC